MLGASLDRQRIVRRYVPGFAPDPAIRLLLAPLLCTAKSSFLVPADRVTVWNADHMAAELARVCRVDGTICVATLISQ
jgi:hypothetical protein